MHSCSTKELRRNQTTPGLKPILCDLTNGQKPQSFSDLVRSDKGREEEKLDPRLHTCTPCAWRANTGERLSRLWLDLSPEKHSVTHALASASVDRANTVCVTHTAAAGAKLAAAATTALLAQDHPQVMFKNREERTDAGLFHHFPPPYPACISEVANANVFLFFFPCDSWAR